MKDQYKTKRQLIDEQEVLRNQFVGPKKTEANRKRAKEELHKASLYTRSLIEASLTKKSHSMVSRPRETRYAVVFAK